MCCAARRQSFVHFLFGYKMARVPSWTCLNMVFLKFFPCKINIYIEYRGPLNMWPRYDILRCSTMSSNCLSAPLLCHSSFVIWAVQEILNSRVHNSKALIRFCVLTLCDQVSTPYSTIGHMWHWSNRIRVSSGMSVKKEDSKFNVCCSYPFNSTSHSHLREAFCWCLLITIIFVFSLLICSPMKLIKWLKLQNNLLSRWLEMLIINRSTSSVNTFFSSPSHASYKVVNTFLRNESQKNMY